MSDEYSDEEFDKLKTKVLKYILYSKRTENDIRKKFNADEGYMLDDVIEYLKEAGYINDTNYIDRAVSEFKKLKNLSIREVEYKLLQKGISKGLVDEYIYEHRDELLCYEINSAKKLITKKNNMEMEDRKRYLLSKGYMQESIEIAMDEE